MICTFVTCAGTNIPFGAGGGGGGGGPPRLLIPPGNTFMKGSKANLPDLFNINVCNLGNFSCTLAKRSKHKFGNVE
jgi:hypothetical protein